MSMEKSIIVSLVVIATVGILSFSVQLYRGGLLPSQTALLKVLIRPVIVRVITSKLMWTTRCGGQAKSEF